MDASKRSRPFRLGRLVLVGFDVCDARDGAEDGGVWSVSDDVALSMSLEPWWLVEDEGSTNGSNNTGGGEESGDELNSNDLVANLAGVRREALNRTDIGDGRLLLRDDLCGKSTEQGSVTDLSSEMEGLSRIVVESNRAKQPWETSCLGRGGLSERARRRRFGSRTIMLTPGKQRPSNECRRRLGPGMSALKAAED